MYFPLGSYLEVLSKFAECFSDPLNISQFLTFLVQLDSSYSKPVKIFRKFFTSFEICSKKCNLVEKMTNNTQYWNAPQKNDPSHL